MGTRTVQFLGKAYAESGDVSIVATLNGTEVHNGVVPTTAGTPPEKNPATNYEVLFQFDVDDTVQDTTLPCTVDVTGGTLILIAYATNKFDPNDLDRFVPNTEANKSDIVIDSVPFTPTREPGEDGAWHLQVEDGSHVELNWILRPLNPGTPGAA